MTDDTGNYVDTDDTGTTDDGIVQTPAPARNTAQSRIQELIEEKKALQAKLQERESASAQDKFEIETQYARDLYGETVDDPSVQEFKKNNPTLTYKQVFGAMGIEVPTASGGVSTPGRSVGSLSSVGKDESYTLAELNTIRNNDPTRYEEITNKIASGDAKLRK